MGDRISCVGKQAWAKFGCQQQEGRTDPNTMILTPKLIYALS